MRDINHVVLVGRLTRDAELKYTNNGTALSKFSLAVNRSIKRGDQWTDEVSFFDCTLWGKQAEAVSQYLTKGKQVAIDGELRQNRWEQDGQNRSKVEINANNLQLLGGSGGRGGQGAGGQDRNFAPSESQNYGGDNDTFDDDIPF
jgi:single-strand DNA-binding protein